MENQKHVNFYGMDLKQILIKKKKNLHPKALVCIRLSTPSYYFENDFWAPVLVNSTYWLLGSLVSTLYNVLLIALTGVSVVLNIEKRISQSEIYIIK